jgi:hypothetical protein
MVKQACNTVTPYRPDGSSRSAVDDGTNTVSSANQEIIVLEENSADDAPADVAADNLQQPSRPLTWRLISVVGDGGKAAAFQAFDRERAELRDAHNFSTGLRCCGGRLSRLFATMASPRELAIQTRAYEIAIVVCNPAGGEAEPESEDIVAALRSRSLTVRSIAVEDDGEQKHLLLCNASAQLLAAQHKKILRNRWLRSTGAVSNPPSLADEVDGGGEPAHLAPALRLQALHDIISHCDIGARAGASSASEGGAAARLQAPHPATLLRFDQRVETVLPLHDAKANVGFARAVFGFDENGFRPGLRGLLLTTADVRGHQTPPDSLLPTC